MHYFIDGYNLLFRLSHHGGDLQSQREAIIYDLNKKISLVKINVSIVFDATSQIGEQTRTHFDQLEIIFTGEGETADEYIVEEIINHPTPQLETVVTSDKPLARRVRNRSAQTETVEEFILWLNQAYKNKIRQVKKEKRSSAISVPSSPPQSNSRPLVPSKDAPLEAYADYYAQVFESGWQEILVREEADRKQNSESQQQQKKTPRHPKQRRDLFEPAQTAEEKAATETERWLNIFEKKLNKPLG